jgi:glutamyl aminopeptidase
MPEVRSKIDTPCIGFTEVAFLKSVPMVTYLAIFIVCDLTYTDTITEIHKIPMRVYGTESQVKRLNYAAKISSAIADFYETYFDIKYPLPKLDMAAIPDYSSGATEHWGLITYREANLIYDPIESSFANKVRVATVIAHELAHQWFGNLMTVFWWNDLWLNEGFASYIEYKGMKAYEKDWDTDCLFLTSDLHRVLALDSTLASHPIVVGVDTPDQINSVFDTISYSKGASVIRMLETFMGPEDFRKGIHNFLVKYAYKNAVTQDLFDELHKVSSQSLDITKIMNTWTKQKGYPILTLTEDKKGDSSSSEEGMHNSYSVTQQRFLSDPEAYKHVDEASPYDYKWEVPITYMASTDNQVHQVWLHSEMNFIKLPIPNEAQWLKLNIGQTGYYRVNYPEEHWIAFAEMLFDWANNARINSSKECPLKTADRVNLLNDAFALAGAHRLPYSVALNLTKYLVGERELAPWETALEEIHSLCNILYYSNVYPLLNNFLSNLIQPIYNELGWNEKNSENENYTTTQLRPLILSMACKVGNQNCLSFAGQLFRRWKEEGTQISPDLRTVVYSYGIKLAGGDQQTWDWLFDRYRNESNAQEKAKLLRGLASIDSPWLLSRLIELARDIGNVREQDYFTLLANISNNRIGEPIVWDFYRNEWNYLVDRFSLNDRLLGRMITVITGRFSTALRLEEMKEFFKKNPEAGAGEQYRKIALETVESNIRFRQSHSKEIHNWLQNNSGI